MQQLELLNPYKGLDCSNGGCRLNVMVERKKYDDFRKARLVKGTVTILTNLLFDRMHTLCEQHGVFNLEGNPLDNQTKLEHIIQHVQLTYSTDTNSNPATKPSGPRKSPRRTGRKANASNDNGGVDSTRGEAEGV